MHTHVSHICVKMRSYMDYVMRSTYSVNRPETHCVGFRGSSADLVLVESEVNLISLDVTNRRPITHRSFELYTHQSIYHKFIFKGMYVHIKLKHYYTKNLGRNANTMRGPGVDCAICIQTETQSIWPRNAAQDCQNSRSSHLSSARFPWTHRVKALRRLVTTIGQQHNWKQHQSSGGIQLLNVYARSDLRGPDSRLN